VLNAAGYGSDQKWKLLETQVRRGLKQNGLDNKLALLDFQMQVADSHQRYAEF
jgi:hypothetical protein